jgi:hypothetical protein
MSALLSNVLFALCLLALCPTPKAFGVNPPPDGGYPNFNTAEGENALLNLTTGAGNTAVGSFSLESLTTGGFNTAIGADALVLNTGDNNTATGAAALLLNTTGANNTANGTAALVNNSTGEDNTAVGAFALNSNTASSNTAIGSNALFGNNTGGSNTAIGDSALFSNTTGSENTATGFSALFSNTTGSLNTATGHNALFNNTTGTNNTATGLDALFRNIDGQVNTATGAFALSFNVGGSSNTADGKDALINNTEGNGNTAVGSEALFNIRTGSFNTALGENAGNNLNTGDSNNIDIGADVEGVAGESNTIRIGNNDITDAFIRGISGTTIASGAAVLVAANGHLGTATSSKRFKEDIKPMDKASETLFSLKPVMFRYKKQIDPAGTQQFGLVAEDVEKANPDLVVRDESGAVNTVRYDQVNAMLLNEFLKEHQTVRKQGRAIADLNREISTLTATVKDQAAEIQEIRTQSQMSKSTTKVVLNNP